MHAAISPSNVSALDTMLPPDCRCYLINLDRSPDRLDAMHAHLSALDIPYERIPGVDGAALDEAEFRQYTRENRYYKPLRRGEVGCYLSHNRALQRFLDSNAAYALILEDDAILDTDACTAISSALTLRDTEQDALRQWDLLKLNRPRRRRIELARLGTRFLVEYGLSVPATTTAALWTRTGAERWLAAFRGCPRPIDCDLQYPWETGLTILSIHPPIARPEDVTTTLGNPITSTRNPWPKLRYELGRIWPRLRHFAHRYGWGILLRWLWRTHLIFSAPGTPR